MKLKSTFESLYLTTGWCLLRRVWLKCRVDGDLPGWFTAECVNEERSHLACENRVFPRSHERLSNRYLSTRFQAESSCSFVPSPPLLVNMLSSRARGQICPALSLDLWSGCTQLCNLGWIRCWKWCFWQERHGSPACTFHISQELSMESSYSAPLVPEEAD